MIIKKLDNGGKIYSDGNYLTAYIVIGRKQYRKRVKTILEGEQYLLGLSENKPTLTATQYSEAILAFSMLPKGVSLIDAIKNGIYKIDLPDKTIVDVLTEFIDEKSKTVREKTISCYKGRINHFLKFCKNNLGDNALLKDVTPEMFRDYVKGMTAFSRKNSRLIISSFVSFAISRKYIKESFIEGTTADNIPPPKREILSIEDSAKFMLALIENKSYHKWIPFFAVQMFAGLRPIEAERLKKENFKDDCIFVTGDVAKSHTFKERVVPMTKILKQYLMMYPIGKEFITACGKTKSKILKDISKSKGLKFSTDILRHTCDTYWFALEQNSAAVASWLGHSEAIANRHYRAKTVTHEEAETYFSLTPKKIRELLNTDKDEEQSSMFKEIVAKVRENQELLQNEIEFFGEDEAAERYRERLFNNQKITGKMLKEILAKEIQK